MSAPSTVAANIIFMWPSTNGSIPSGYSRETALDAKYIKGTAASTNPGDTGGALTHVHNATHTHTAVHTHTIPDSGAGSGQTLRDVNTTNPPETHVHAGNPSTGAADAGLASAAPTTDATNHEPPFFVVIFIKSDGSPTGVPNLAIALVNDTVAPTGFHLADGTGGSSDLTNRYVKGAAAAGDGGATGGATTHTHTTIASHDHGTNFTHGHATVNSSTTAAGLTAGTISGGNAGTATSTHVHALTFNGAVANTITSNTDTVSGSGSSEPPYKTLSFIQNVSGSTSTLQVGVIGLWIQPLASIPANWNLCDGTNSTPDMRGLYIKGAAGTVGTTGGSLTHSSHTAAGHTHAIVAHTHGINSSAGAGENRTAGAVAAATTAHTHTWAATGSTSLTSGGVSTTTIDNYTDTQPPFYTVAFIQAADVPSEDNNYPAGWNRTKVHPILTM